MDIQYQYFPKSCSIPNELLQIVKVFCEKEDEITSFKHRLTSNEVRHLLSDDITRMGYQVKTSKKVVDKIKIPILLDETSR